MSKNSSNYSNNLPRLFRALFVLLGSVVLFYLAQIVAVFLLAILLNLIGWDAGQITSWLTVSNRGQFVLILLAEATVIFGVWLILKNRGKKWADIGIKKFIKRADVKLIIIGFAIYFVLSLSVRLLIDVFVPAVNLDQSQQIGFDSADSLKQLLVVFIALCVAVPIGEEVLFRGLMFGGLKKYLNSRTALVLTSATFGAAHLELFSGSALNWGAAVDTAVFSAVLIWVYQKSGNLWAPIGLHALKNTIAFLYLFVF